MHHANSEAEFFEIYDDAIAKWSELGGLENFIRYFQQTWGRGSAFRNWQIYHTKCGYACTNNPVETFNNALKQVRYLA
jgi:hypothetical protein